jgi:putative transcriptional regulator
MKRIMARCLPVGFVCVLFAMSAQAQQEFSPTSVMKGMLLVASPSLADPNFTHTVLLIVEHGQGGTIGLILNHPTDVLLAEVLPDLPALKQTNHRLFGGGPVGRTQLVLLFRLRQVLPDVRHIVNGIYTGTPRVLERVMASPKPDEAFRAFTGFAGWAPGQLEYEMRQGSWGVLSSNAFDIFSKDPETLWQDSIGLLQAPRAISNEW